MTYHVSRGQTEGFPRKFWGVILGKVLFWVDLGDGGVYYGEMGVGARVGGEAGEFEGTHVDA